MTLIPHLNMLRGMRGDVAVLDEHADEHGEELRALRRQIHDWRAATRFARAKICGPEISS